MRRAPVVLAALVVVAVIVLGVAALTRGGDDPTPPVERDASRPFDRELVRKQAEAQAEQKIAAEEALATKAAKLASTEQVLRVTLRDVTRPDIYVASGAACVRAGRAPSRLVVSDLDGTYGNELVTRSIPARARIGGDGVCEVTMTLRVPDVRAYRLGVAIEGRGISLSTDPGPTDVVPRGGVQAVIVRR